VTGYRLFTGITAAVAALILVLTQVVGGDGGSDLPDRADEIRLEPVNYTPPDAFTESVAEGPSTPGPEPFPVEPAPTGTIRSAPAGTVGLFGGSLRQSSCARGRLVDFLERDPVKARAWVGALNADPTLSWSGGRRLEPFQIRDYVFELTPVILRTDTWVTNHGFSGGGATRGFSGGRATPIQSVLQAGTAVLVDAYGIPRVKCYCGNPLLPPRRFRPVYRGPRWPGFDPGKVLVLTRPPRIIDVFVLTNVQTGGPIRRPPGTDGGDDSTGPTTGPSPDLSLPPDVQLGTGEVQVTLLWTAGDDLDLHVIDPEGAEIYFGQRTSPSGGQIDHDDTGGCETSSTHVENIFWPEGGAPSGEYRAFVQNFRGCGGAASYELRVIVAGAVVHEESGSISSGSVSEQLTFTA
jgi:hypothetical protein